MRPQFLLFVLVCGSSAAACGGGGAEGSAGPPLDGANADVALADPGGVAVDTGGSSDPGGEQSFAGGPNFGQPCAVHGDCPDGWCAQSGAERLCTANCVDACPAGWGCAAVDLFGGGDLTSVCVRTDAGGPPCGDGICEAGEDPIDCPADCCGGECGDGRCDADCAETATSCPADCDVRCGNGLCQPAAGESVALCPMDCAVCGDAVCSPGEGPNDCAIDCCGGGDGEAGCGDGRCIGYACGENPDTCPTDCGTACGDGTCDRGESPQVCPADCKHHACGNQVCEPTDGGPVGCPADCASACGDCVCQGDERFEDCPVDCGFCGDGVCSLCAHMDEPARCPADCDDAPVAELCNGVDDDGDGATDEGFEAKGSACDSDDADDCALGALACRPDGSALFCPRESESSTDLVERCNGADDDCDGRTDEGFDDLGADCDPDGPCGEGTRRCTADGAGTECLPVAAGSEICDGVDNDCDGDVDEGFDGLGAACQPDDGCPHGTMRCAPDGQSTVCASDRRPETCDLVDDDCDGDIDEGPCDDRDPCTRDRCVGVFGCVHEHDTACDVPISRNAAVALPYSLSFRNGIAGCGTPPQTISLWNTGAGGMTLTSAVVDPACPQPFVLSNLPTVPIAFRERATFEVRFRPTTQEPVSCRLTLQVDRDGFPTETLTIFLEGVVDDSPTYTTHVFYPDDLTVDVLVVVDDSGSLAQGRELLGAALDAFVEAADADTRWRLGLVGMNPDREYELVGDPRWAWYDEPGAGWRLDRLAPTIDDGSGSESGFEAAVGALSPPLNQEFRDEQGKVRRCETDADCPAPFGCYRDPEVGSQTLRDFCRGPNFGIGRRHARLEVIFFSDEDDQSFMPVEYYADALTALRGTGRADLISAQAIIGPPAGCISPEVNAVHGRRYEELITELGGLTHSICGLDYAALGRQMAAAATGRRLRLPLGSDVTHTDMRVFRDDVECTDGWVFNEDRKILWLIEGSGCLGEPGGLFGGGGQRFRVEFTPQCEE